MTLAQLLFLCDMERPSSGRSETCATAVGELAALASMTYA